MVSVRRKRLQHDDLVQLQAFVEAGWSHSAISKRLKCSTSTVRYWAYRKLPEVGAGKHRSPTKTMRRRRVELLKLAKQTTRKGGKTRPRFCGARAMQAQLAKHSHMIASRWTIQRDLRSEGYFPVVRPRVPTVYDGDYATRLKFARQSLQIGVFSDEKIFTCNDYTTRLQWVRRREDALPRERQRYTQRVMVWAAIGRGFFVWQVLSNRKRVSATDEDTRRHGILNSAYYRNKCLPLVVPHLVSNDLLFMQDNAKPHTANATIDYLERKGVRVVENWPPRSPDLNPLETLWALLAADVAALFPQTTAELRSAIADVFGEYKASRMGTIDKLVDSFPARCKKVVEHRGRF